MTGSLDIDPLSGLRADVERFLRPFSGTKVVLIPNPGNAGDCLILAGTLHAFERAAINFTVTTPDRDMTGQTVFIGGGGNLVDAYRDIRVAIEACRATAAKIVLLPHTIRGHEDVIESLDERATLFCRDARSVEHVRLLNSRVECLAGHDMALHCDVHDVLANAELSALGWPVLQAALAKSGLSLDDLARRPVVRFMRTDWEALYRNTTGDLDISRAFGSVADVRSSAVTTWCFLKAISVAPRIVTDRLHVAIGAALLGTPCELHDNSYNKNRLVYDFSLRGFPSLTFVPSGGAAIADQPARRDRSLLGSMQRRARQMYANLQRPGGVSA